MTSATKLLKASGSVPVGHLALFPMNMTNQVDWPDGKKFLKSGVIAKGADFPDVPSVHLKQLNPMVKVADIGSGGSWRGLCLDASGYPLVAHQEGWTGGLYRIVGTSATTNTDVNPITGFANGSPGTYVNRIVSSRAVQVIAVGYDQSKSNYASGNLMSSGIIYPFTNTVNMVAPFGINTASPATYAIGASHTTGVFLGIIKGSSTYNWGNGSVFSQANMPSSADWQCCCPGSGNNWVAIAQGSTVAADSTNGCASWTARSMPSAANWNDVCWNGTVYCAVATGSTAAATSSDGQTWTARTLPSSQNWTSVAAHPTSGMLVAVASGTNVYATSTDNGVNWTQRTLPASAAWENVIWSPALLRWVAIASDGKAGVVLSTDGINWTVKSMPRALSFTKLESWGGNLYAFTGKRGSMGTNPIVAKSTDNGATWTYLGPRYNIQVGNSSTKALAMKYLNGKFIMVSVDSNTFNLWTSNDAVTWTYTTPSLNSTPQQAGDMAYGAGLYVMVMQQHHNGTSYQNTNWIWTSPDLVTWTGRTNSIFGQWTSVLFTGTRFVAAGGPSQAGSFDVVSTSADGINWTTAPYTGFNNQDIAGSVALTYDAVRGKVFVNTYYNTSTYAYSAESSDGGLTWTYAPYFAQFCVPAGSRWVAAAPTTTYTANDVNGIDSYGHFAHGVSPVLLDNMPTTSGVTVAPFAAATFHSGTNYFLNANSVYTVDTNDWIDNRTLSQVGNSYAYMRVK